MRAAVLLVMGAVVGIGSFGTAGESRAATQTLTYVYDDLGRMTHAIYDSAWVIEYTWDENGNLLRREAKAFTVDVEPGPGAALLYWLGPAAPNPFGKGTQIRFSLAERTHVRLDVYDAAGRHVRSIVNEELGPGEHGTVWDGLSDAGRRLPSNVFFYVLKAGSFEATRQMVLLR